MMVSIPRDTAPGYVYLRLCRWSAGGLGIFVLVLAVVSVLRAPTRALRLDVVLPNAIIRLNTSSLTAAVSIYASTSAATVTPVAQILANRTGRVAVIYALPESGVVDESGTLGLHQSVLSLTGQPDIILVGNPAALAIVAESVTSMTGCDTVLVPLPTIPSVDRPAASILPNNCRMSEYALAVTSFLTSGFLDEKQLEKYEHFMLLGVGLLNTVVDSGPALCDPFLLVHARGADYAFKCMRITNFSSSTCVDGLVSAVKYAASAASLPVNDQFAVGIAASSLPLVQILRTVTWKQQSVRTLLSSVGSLAHLHGWDAASIFHYVAAAIFPDTADFIDMTTSESCASVAALSAVFSAFTVPAAEGGAHGIYLTPNISVADRTTMLNGSFRDAFVAVVRETQAAMISYSERLVVVETDAGNGYVSLIGLDQQGPARTVQTVRKLFRNEELLGGYRGYLEAVLIEDDNDRRAAARANAALVGPKRINACVVKSDDIIVDSTVKETTLQSHYNSCSLADVLFTTGARTQREGRGLSNRILQHGSTLNGSSKKPVALLVINEPSTSALQIMQALMRDGKIVAVAADLTGNATGRIAWEPFLVALSAAGFTTQGLVRPYALRLSHPEPPGDSMIDVPSDITTLVHAWRKVTAFVSARKPVAHMDHECNGTVRHFAVMSTDSQPVYGFSAVVATIFWREMLGWGTIVFTLDDLHEVIRSALEASGAQVVYLGSFNNTRHSWVAQMSRLTGAMLPNIQPCDYLITSDSDIAPLSVPYFLNPLLKPSHDLYMHNAGGAGGGQYPMCYVGMTASAWRFILAPFGPPSSTPDDVIRSFATELQHDWFADQRTVFLMVARWALFFGNSRLLRFGHGTRIDRKPDIATMRHRLNTSGDIIDLHMFRPTYAPETWAFYRDELIPHFIRSSRVDAVQKEMDNFIRKFTIAFADSNGLVETGSGPSGQKSKSPVYVPPAEDNHA